MVMDSYQRAEDEYLIVDQTGEEEYEVTNVGHCTMYHVTLVNDCVVSCDCPHHIYRGVPCKHIIKVAMITGKKVL
jgi:hypothetical protein